MVEPVPLEAQRRAPAEALGDPAMHRREVRVGHVGCPTQGERCRERNARFTQLSQASKMVATPCP